ncbi:E3 ubiquitin-protein ligase RMA1H1, partial [Cucurbita argyrosperma subsp. sororia]
MPSTPARRALRSRAVILLLLLLLRYASRSNPGVKQICESVLYMAFEHYFSRRWRRCVPASSMENSEKFKACFDCNICLEFASEPIVTLCGHLYCWPCIYKWLHVQSASLLPDEPPQCPVCKADISHTTMVPLYGRGQSAKEAEVDPRGLLIPPRPSALGNKVLASIGSNNASGEQLVYGDLYQNQNDNFDMYDSYEEDSSSSLFNMEDNPVGSFGHPTARMFGETVYGRLFGSSENLYAHPNSYALTGSGSPQLRMQEKSLNRISIFLFCCFVLCLAIF